MGETPVTYNDKRSLPSRLHIQIKKAGYRDLDFYLDKSFDYTGIVFLNPYTFLAFPWLASGLDSKYSINLRSLKISKEASSDPPAKEDDIDTIELTP